MDPIDRVPALAADLCVILDREQASSEALLLLLDDERRAIRGLSSRDLLTCTTAKVRLLENLEALEDRRTSVLGKLAFLWGLDPDRLTLEEVAARLPAETAGRVLRRRDRLLKSVAAALEATRLNGSVMARVRTFLDDSLSCWRPAAEPAGLYSDAGALRPAGAGGALVEREG